MRTDVKIGVAVGLLFVIAVGSYYAIFDRGNVTDANRPGEIARTDPGGAREGDRAVSEGTALPRFGGISPKPATPRIARRETTERTPPARETPVGPTVHETPAVPTVRETPIVGETPVGPTARETPTVGETPVGPTASETPVMPETPIVASIRETPIVPPIHETPIGPTIRETPAGPATPRVDETPPGAERTYTVQKGDAGFWAIAEKAYGDGKYWTLIAKANPDADSNALRVGKILKIPAKPVTRITESERDAGGGLITMPTGQREYVVKQGDAGFWGIAQSVYGNGKYWALIAKANPKVNSNGLQAGDKLVMPPPPTGAVGEGAGTATGGPAITLGPGQKLYVVDKTDVSGFWGIAKKAYGDARYWQVVAKANPQVSSGSLKAGQQLILPELTEEMRREASGTAPTSTAPRETPRETPKDVEDIGRRPVFHR